MKADAAQELVGMIFGPPDSRRYNDYLITEYDPDRDRLVIQGTLPGVKGSRFHYDGHREGYAMEPCSFEAAFDLAGWEIRSQNNDCTNCGSHPVRDDDYLCYWCRYNRAFIEVCHG